MISIVRLIDALGITDEADVPMLTQWRDAALAFIQTQTNRYFGPIVSTTEYVRGDGTRSLWLRELPQVGGAYTTTVSEYTYPGATGTSIPLTTGFVLRMHERDAELLRAGSSGVWTRDYDYAVTYSKGFAEDTGPKDIEALLIELVRLKWSSGGEEVMKSETVGGYSYTRFDAADIESVDGASATLDAWRRLVFA